MNTQVLESTMAKKCWFLKWPPCSIFPKTQSRFDQIIKNRIFLKSTLKRLLKSVQDGISRPLDSRVIQKNKKVKRIAGHPVVWFLYWEGIEHPVLCIADNIWK